MVETLAHRGPDGSGTWHTDSVGLGHCMLWTTPESLHEQLPLVNSTGDVILTADARIDNREELLSALAMNTWPANQISDSEIILKAYEKWGERCLQKLLGAFAFAIWDKRLQRLICARDHMGVKSFYYYLSEDIFVFASEIKSLIQLPHVPSRINEVRVADYLAQVYADKTSTLYQQIYRLPPAHCMTVGVRENQIRTYWSLDLSNEIRLKSDEEYAGSFYEIFEEAVRCRLRSSYKIGFALSGGLDSSSIVCSARNLNTKNFDQPIQTFSAIFPSLRKEELRKVDESEYIQTVLSMGSFSPHYIRGDNVSPLIDFDKLLWFTDEIYFAPNLFMYWALYSAAYEEGVRVYLDGIDGDVTVSHGLEYLVDLFRTGKWKSLYNEAVAISNLSVVPKEPSKIIWRNGIRPLIPGSIVNIKRTLQRKDPPGLYLINPDLINRNEYRDRIQTIMNDGSAHRRTAREAHKSELSAAYLTLNLELLDKVAAAFSLDIRLPFFDRRLVEFCLAIPAEQKLSNGRTRYIFRRAMEGVLPQEVQWRSTKADFFPNFTRALLEFERETMDRIILSETDIIEPYVNLPALHSAYLRFVNQSSPGVRDAFIIYSALTLALWLKYVAATRNFSPN
jgi:asparagine synthase (glutamine-hydrolysing)